MIVNLIKKAINNNNSFFTSMNYQKTIKETFNFQPFNLTTKNGFLPLFLIKQKTGNKLISMPFTTETNISYNSEDEKNSLIQAAIKLTKELDLDYLKIRSKKDLKINLLKKENYYHLILKLDKEEIIWNNFNKKLRNAIRKAEKNNLTTDSGINYFNDFYRLFKKNMRDLGTPVDTKKFFKNLINNFQNKIDIVVTKKEDKVISAIFLIKDNNRIKSEWASSDRKYFGLNAAQLTYWHAIKKYCNEFEEFDFGRSVKDEGTYLFKKKFNAKPEQLYYYYYINKGTMPNILKTNWKRQLFTKTWKKLPLIITDNLGPIIRRQFP